MLLVSLLRAADSSAEQISLSGLHEPVEILRDKWGVSHIYAANEHDLFFAQGFNVARDRLFQLELWRRQATGTMAEITGKSDVNRDIGNRLFMYRGDLTEELNWYHPHGSSIIASFVEGINAFIAETRRDPKLLSPEFSMLGIKPGDWTSAVVISRFNGLAGNLHEELYTALAVRAVGADKVKDLASYQPSDPDLTIDPAIDASLLKPDILELYDAFRIPFRFPGIVETPKTAELSLRREDIGSNNWVVAPKLTSSGYPLMMNDPHRLQQTPSLRYLVHLVAPGWNVIGGGEPALPGVSIGHNEFGAWGLTIFGSDSEDLYVYDTNPENPLEYKFQGDWQTMQVIRESIPVKDQKPVAVELKYTRHGPVIYEDRRHHKAYAVRAAWREIGSAPYLASLRIDQVRSWQEFRDACAYSRMPAENMVWADRDGNIGYQAVGIAPQRPHWSGLVPVPGDGRYEWDGFLAAKALPNVFNPEKGFYNTSNEYQIPPGWPYTDALHYTWADPFRANSVAEFLSSGRRFTVADMAELQNNNLSIPARRIVPLLRDLKLTDSALQAQSKLAHWDFVLDRDSVPAGIYEMFQRRLLVNTRALFVPKPAEHLIIPSMTRIISWLYAPDGRFGADPVAGRDELLTKSLQEAVEELTKRLGSDMRTWKLGAYHHATIFHPLSPELKPEEQARFNVGDMPRGGDSYTITATGSTDNQESGGSLKVIIDTENWDNSIAQNNPGQSGNMDDPHYRDLYELWSRGKYFPIFFSRSGIESVTEKKVELSPSASAKRQQ
jgi:penicillin amidase